MIKQPTIPPMPKVERNSLKNGDTIYRRAAMDALAKIAREKFNLSDEYDQYLAGLMDGDRAIRNLPPAEPTDEGIQRIQDLEQAQLEKAYQLGYEEGKKDAEIEQQSFSCGQENDTISRKAAIDAIFSEPLYKSGMKKRDVDVVVPAIYEKIKSLPPAEPNTQCIAEIKIDRDDLEELVAEKVDEIKASITEQEIIRCKDCKHWVMALPDIGCCQNIRHAEAIWWLGDDFCSRAERREG